MRIKLPGLVVILRYLAFTNIRWDDQLKEFVLRYSRIFMLIQLSVELLCFCSLYSTCVNIIIDSAVYHSVTDIFYIKVFRLMESTVLIWQFLWIFSMQQTLLNSLVRVQKLSNHFGLSDVPSWMLFGWIVSCGLAIFRHAYWRLYSPFRTSLYEMFRDLVYILYKVSTSFVKTLFMVFGHRIINIMNASRRKMENALKTPNAASARLLVGHNLKIQNEMVKLCELDLSKLYGLPLCLYTMQDILESTLLFYSLWDTPKPFVFQVLMLYFSAIISLLYAWIPMGYNNPRIEFSYSFLLTDGQQFRGGGFAMRTTIPGLIVILRCLTLGRICWDEKQKQFDLRSRGICTIVQFLMPLIFLCCLCVIILNWKVELMVYTSETDKYFLELVRWSEPTFLIFQYLLVFSMRQSLTIGLVRLLEISQDLGLSEVPSWMMLAWLANIGFVSVRLFYVHAILISKQNFNFLAHNIVYGLFKVSSCFVKIFYLAVGHRTMDIMAASRQQIEKALRSTSNTQGQRETIFHYLSILNEMMLICELDWSKVFGVLLCMFMIQDILEATMLSYLAWNKFNEHFPDLLHFISLVYCGVYASIPLVYNDPGEEVSKVGLKVTKTFHDLLEIVHKYAYPACQ